MIVWRSLEEVSTAESAVAIGVFDGVHRGHQHVLSTLVDTARRKDLRATVVTFDPHPLTVIRPDVAIEAIDTLRRRLELMDSLGVDAVLVLPFDRQTAAESAEEFAEDTLRRRLGARVVVVGEDFRFGHRARGDVTLLRALGLDVLAVGLARGPDEARWSSTRVRQLVKDGEVSAAADVLGHTFRVEGEVRRGDGRGRQLGYPTANVVVGPRMLTPADGVYAGWFITLEDQRRHPAAISVGTNPTFAGAAHRVESFLLDAGTPDAGLASLGPDAGATTGPDAGAATGPDLYGKQVAVELVEHLRPMAAFPSVADLLAQMALDVAQARAALLG